MRTEDVLVVEGDDIASTRERFELVEIAVVPAITSLAITAAESSGESVRMRNDCPGKLRLDVIRAN